MNGSAARSGLRGPLALLLLQPLSLAVTGFLLLSIFAVHAGLVGTSYVLPALLTLAGAVALRYAAVYHRFSKRAYRAVVLVPLAAGFVAAAAVAVDAFLAAVSLAELRAVFRRSAFRPGEADFLPEWWVAAILALAGALALLGAATTRDLSPYPKPTRIREVATSPAYFGLACAFFGLWAVLFVGIAIQRIIVIAPLFEELLKFGVALLVGSVLFDRSLAARLGVAIVVGSLFGLVEHATTYPAETDLSYLFRTLFHAVTATLSVAVYTLFESRGEARLQWIAPACSILLHFFHNTFVVLSAVISVSLFGSQNPAVPLVYGGAAVLLATVLLVLAGVYGRAIVAIYRPLEHVLSDLV